MNWANNHQIIPISRLYGLNCKDLKSGQRSSLVHKKSERVQASFGARIILQMTRSAKRLLTLRIYGYDANLQNNSGIFLLASF